MNAIGVGIIGASIGSWASNSHVPVVKSLPDYDLRAISTTRRESAEAAGREFGVNAVFDDHHDLIAHPGVDLVVVSVRVGRHRELVNAALDAGKMVYSEWPLALGLPQATELAERARAAGVRTVVGLQGRYAPAVSHARALIGEGYVGDVLGTTLVGSGMVWGGEVASPDQAYWFDDANGASPLTSAAMHAIDTLHSVLGEWDTLAANLTTGREYATLMTDGSRIPVTVADQVSVIGTLRGGASASVFYRGGASRGDNFRWEINGSEGDLVLTSDWGNVQVADLQLAGGRGADTKALPIEPPARYHAETPDGPPGVAHNVARLYTGLARDLREGTHTVPDFAHALSRHRIIDAVGRAARTGRTQQL